MKLESMSRFKELALPKTYEESMKEPWALTPAMKNYEPTENIKKMAQPIIHDDSALIQSFPIPINPTALTYKGTVQSMNNNNNIVLYKYEIYYVCISFFIASYETY